MMKIYERGKSDEVREGENNYYSDVFEKVWEDGLV